MPLLSVFISFGVPAALGVYWIFKSFLGVAKQAVLYFVMPLPKFTDEDYKAAEKEIGAIIEKSSSAKKSGRVVRSLHHIDDDEEDEAVARASGVSTRYGDDEEESPKAEAAPKIAPATMKKYDRPKKKGESAPVEEKAEDTVPQDASDENKE